MIAFIRAHAHTISGLHCVLASFEYTWLVPASCHACIGQRQSMCAYNRDGVSHVVASLDPTYMFLQDSAAVWQVLQAGLPIFKQLGRKGRNNLWIQSSSQGLKFSEVLLGTGWGQPSSAARTAADSMWSRLEARPGLVKPEDVQAGQIDARSESHHKALNEFWAKDLLPNAAGLQLPKFGLDAAGLKRRARLDKTQVERVERLRALVALVRARSSNRPAADEVLKVDGTLATTLSISGRCCLAADTWRLLCTCACQAVWFKFEGAAAWGRKCLGAGWLTCHTPAHLRPGRKELLLVSGLMAPIGSASSSNVNGGEGVNAKKRKEKLDEHKRRSENLLELLKRVKQEAASSKTGGLQAVLRFVDEFSRSQLADAESKDEGKVRGSSDGLLIVQGCRRTKVISAVIAVRICSLLAELAAAN